MIVSPLETGKEDCVVTLFMSTQFRIKIRCPAKQQTFHGGGNEGPERLGLTLTRYEPVVDRDRNLVPAKTGPG
jgi:hypothetical protein